MALSLLMATGCGSPAPPATLQGSPLAYLLTLDDLATPDFTVDSPPHPVSASSAAADSRGAARLAAAGYRGGATVDFFRQAGDIALVNGPVQVRDTVEQFDTAGGADSVFAADVTALEGVPGSVAVSTGSLGDRAHAVTRTVTDPAIAVRLEQITVEWRVANLIAVLVVRGRYGGIHIEDALVLAHRQTAIELGLGTPTPLPTPRPTPSVSPPPATATPTASPA